MHNDNVVLFRAATLAASLILLTVMIYFAARQSRTVEKHRYFAALERAAWADTPQEYISIMNDVRRNYPFMHDDKLAKEYMHEIIMKHYA